jgi:hypothetical protein
MRYDAFIGGSHESAAYTADQEQTYNMYVVPAQSRAEKPWLAPISGVTSLASTTDGVGRAHFFQDGREFAIIGPTLYEISVAGVATSRGSVAMDANPATICSSGDAGGELFITSGGNGYVYTLATDTLAAVAALSGIADFGGYLDGYFWALDASTSTVYLSNLLDGTTWTTGIDYAERSKAGDRFISAIQAGPHLWLLGSQTTEVWYNSGATFPLEPIPEGFLQFGVYAPHSVRLIGTDAMWLGVAPGGRKCILRATGFQPQVVSTHAVETAIDGYADADDAIGDVRSEGGHTFYVLNFDAAGVSWALDVDTGLWTQFGAWTGLQYGAWRPRQHVFAFGGMRCLDASGGSVFSVDSAVQTDADGSYIRRLRRSPALVKDLEDVTYAALELDMDVGIGNALAVDPQVMLRSSNDGGKTWGSEQWRSAGKVGEYGKRVRWNRMGRSRRRVFEVVMADAAPWRITGAYLTVAK